ncbi:MAG: GTPase Era [Rhodospirillaceae bacterium]|nr:GTPase Era [Rhodospirillaceae bacterium]MBT5239809.1 GTPase Era [Rhodospirillaceae bacterium]MBT5567175.1 GTPase Era [Rhodospirillaceae bacterium]MBT6089388.1 GTPase Era [Rhodospirillaceae bacterium]MBT6960582.1 GTPase Era [Rhodospirillaceae bacterium]
MSQGNDAQEGTRCGFVAVLGAPNAGKSTLVNDLVGTKVSIVSPKVQTTRTIVRGIALKDQSQIVFVDTPGIFEGAKRRLERAMVSVAWTGAEDADAILLVVDGARSLEDNTKAILTALAKRQKTRKTPVMLVVNKVDAAKKENLLELTTWLNEAVDFAETFMVSALSGDGTDRILEVLTKAMPLSPWLFPEDDVSDMPQRLLAAEITREKLFLSLRQELPYDCMVDTDSWKEFQDGSARIDQTVYVTRDSQKPIVLGKGGKGIKAVGEQARKELESLLGRRLHLFLHVKVEPKWRERRSHFSAWGLDFDA